MERGSKELPRERIARRAIIKSCLDLACNTVGEGSLFVIELDSRATNGYYTKVFPALKGPGGRGLSVLRVNDSAVIKHLSELDGATIINGDGRMKEFGVTLKKQATYIGHGKRHAFALGTSKLKNVVCILASEEDKHVRVFRDGICLLDIDSKTKLSSGLKQKVVDIMNNPLSKILVASGIATSILTLNPIPAIITITGSSVIVSYGFDRLKALF
ncbi:MAG: diadenylate cyclase [Candidatus Micrarchaeota archaeon]|nr:diadenylate cyclase [Candidatus Micrarchaeota archaeon]